MSTQRIHHSFARSQSSYHIAAVAQAQIADLLAGDLVTAGAPDSFQHVLEFGCGTGHFTNALLLRFATGQLTLNDLVAESAAAIQPILQRHDTATTFQAGPVETLPLPENLNLIASASTLQWVADPGALIARLVRHLAPGGWLAISGFGRAHFAELRALGGGDAAPSYLDPDDWRALLPKGLHLHSVTERRIVLSFPGVIALLRHLRDTGVNANTGEHWTRARLAAFEASYRASQPGDAPLALTYCPVFVVAQKQI